MTQIYLDYAATTPIDARVCEKMLTCMSKEGAFGNASSSHSYGKQAKQMIEEAREKVAILLHARPNEIIWTSGATESINLALKGTLRNNNDRVKHIITIKTEHKAVLSTCHFLESRGYEISYLTPQSNGMLDLEMLQAEIKPNTCLVSVMHVNNETGIVQDMSAIANITSSRGILLHIDAAQSPGKLDINMQNTQVDLMSLCAHKVYGPKGIGALYVRKQPHLKMEPIIDGGGQENGMRSGTLANHQIIGMGEAFDITRNEMNNSTQKIKQLRDCFLLELTSLNNMKINTNLSYTVPHILSLRFDGISSETLLSMLPNIAVSLTSACQSNKKNEYYVLRAMGFSKEQAENTIRFSFGRFTTIDEIREAASEIKKAINLLC